MFIFKIHEFFLLQRNINLYLQINFIYFEIFKYKYLISNWYNIYLVCFKETLIRI